jgi:hypothetical protein
MRAVTAGSDLEVLDLLYSRAAARPSLDLGEAGVVEIGVGLDLEPLPLAHGLHSIEAEPAERPLDRPGPARQYLRRA